MTRNDFNQYVAELLERWPQGFFLARSFRTAEDWNRWSSFEFRARANIRDRELQIENVLSHRRAVVLGEAGSGKSAFARRAIALAADKEFIPVFLPLKSYTGSLEALKSQHAPEEVLTARDVDGSPAQRLYILDGLDEVPASHFDDFLRELSELTRNEPDARILLTSRQAFFVARQERLGLPFEAFYILDFSDEDVDAVLDHGGIDRAAFREAANRSHLSQELGNPLALEALLGLFRDRGSLGTTRSEALQHVVDSALASRPTSDPRRQKRALRMLGVAMEVSAKNQLTDAEAQAVLQHSLRIGADAARTMLDELTQSVLVRTPNGYAFQLHSYGEYLAAEELSEIRERDRVLRLMFLDNTLRPSDSWRNSVSYLIEQHPGIRSYFSRRYPDWTLTSSPAVFDERDRTTIVSELLASMVQDRAYLLHHPTIRSVNLARFVPESLLPQLRAAVDSANDVEAANAVLVLGAYGDRTMAERFLALSLDPNKTAHLQNSALAALERVGNPAFVPQLLDIQNWDESTVMSRVDAAAALMDSTNAELVLAALGRTDAMISSAFYRFQELDTPADIEAVLDALIALPRDAFGSRLSYYLDRFWPSLARRWRPQWTNKVAELILKFEEVGNLDDSDLLRNFIPAMQSLSDHGNAIGRQILERMLEAGRDVHHLYHTIPALIGMADAQWLVQQPGSAHLVGSVRAFGPPETANLLRGPITPEQQEQIDKWQREEQGRQARTERLEHIITTSEDPNALYPALAQLDAGRWPDVDAGRRQWLAAFVGEKLGELDLQNRIQWRSDTELTQPRILPLLLALVKRYEFQLVDDQPLAFALLAETHPTRTYHQRYGLSGRAIEAIEQLLNDPATPAGGLDYVLRFVLDTKLTSPRIMAGVEQIATDGGRPHRARETAIQILAGVGDAEALLRVAPTLPEDLQREVDNHLVDAQHRRTIQRRLQQLIDDPAALASGEVEIHFNNPLSWVGRIRDPEAWDKLRRLRRLALQRGLGRVSSVLAGTLSNIDMMRSAAVIREQVADAPADWQPMLRIRAIELERDATISAAAQAPFEKVLRRLEDATTINRFKIWTEGPTDCPAVDELAHKIPGAETQNIVAQAFGGWNNLLNDHWSPQGLGDGCHDFVMLLDGDRAYDYAQPGFVLRNDVRRVVAKFRRLGIEFHVLERYGLENYFLQHAFETVMGRPLAGHFPLDPRRPVSEQLPGYSKNMNAALARETTVADLAGTDLGDSLERVRRLSGA